MYLTPEGFAKIVIANTEIALAAHDFGRAANDPPRRHELSIQLTAIRKTYEDLLKVVAEYAPDVIRAMELGLRSTHELHATEKTAARP